MPEATGKENVIPPGSPRHAVPENGSAGDSVAASPARKDKSKGGKMVLARVHLLDGTTWDCPIEVTFKRSKIHSVLPYLVFVNDEICLVRMNGGLLCSSLF